jgi:hypothetical protein
MYKNIHMLGALMIIYLLSCLMATFEIPCYSECSIYNYSYQFFFHFVFVPYVKTKSCMINSR